MSNNSQSLDAILDQIVVEQLLRTGRIPPAQIAERYPGVKVSTEELRFVQFSFNPDRLPWSREQEKVIEQYYGRVSDKELTRLVNEVLHRELGTSLYNRSYTSIDVRARNLGLSVLQVMAADGEMTIIEASRFLGVPYEYVINACNRGEIPTKQRGKYRCVKLVDISNWYVKFREILLVRSEILNALDGIQVISKREAMKITGLCETHITRYLQTGVIEAWKLSSLTGPDSRGEWLVSCKSAEAVRDARRQGKLSELLEQHPAYLKIQAKNNAVVAELRRKKPFLGEPDPLTTPKSHFHPGCFTVQQVASHLRLSTRFVYDWIERGELKAEVVVVHRPRYGIRPEEAGRFVEWFRAQGPVSKSGGRPRYQEIAQAGLLSYPDLADRWGVSIAEAHEIVHSNKIPRQQWGRHAAFKRSVIEEFEAAQARGIDYVPPGTIPDTPARRRAAEMGLLVSDDLAARWQTSIENARSIVRRHGLSEVRAGNRVAYHLDDIEQLEQDRVRYPTVHHRKAAEAGLWLVIDAARYLEVDPSTLRKLAKDNKVPYTWSGSLLVFKSADIEAFKQNRDRYPTIHHRNAIEAGMLLIGDLAIRWTTSRSNVLSIVRENTIPYTRFGLLLAFDPADIKVFEQNRTSFAERLRKEAVKASGMTLL